MSAFNVSLLQLVRGCRGFDDKVPEQVVLSLCGCIISDALRRGIAANIENIVTGKQTLLPQKPEVASRLNLATNRVARNIGS